MDFTPKSSKICVFVSGIPNIESLELSLSSVMFGLFTSETQSKKYQGMGAHMDETQSKCLQEPLRNGSAVFT